MIDKKNRWTLSHFLDLSGPGILVLVGIIGWIVVEIVIVLWGCP